MELYEDIIRYVEMEIALLQQAKQLLLSGGRSRAAKLTLEIAEKEAAKSRAKAAPVRIPAVKKVRRAVKTRAAAPRRRKNTRAAEAVIATPSALTHAVPAGPVVVSPEAVRRAQEKALAASVSPALAATVAQPELSEELLRKKWMH
ncbi:hypothetical protein [Silvibacterium sp.]|uniref:hypothetical protein n=1 Tax=Silvibacterium sp. TaxID=1964179 RepID=UPI0039E29881